MLAYEARSGALRSHGHDNSIGSEADFFCIFHPMRLEAEFCFSCILLRSRAKGHIIFLRLKSIAATRCNTLDVSTSAC